MLEMSYQVSSVEFSWFEVTTMKTCPIRKIPNIRFFKEKG